MTPFVAQLNFFVALGAVLMQVALIALLGVYLYERFGKKRTKVGEMIARGAMPVVFVVSVCAASLTLVYSEVFGFLPCGLCWLQRVFMFPMVFIAGAALYLRDRVFAPVYIVVLAIPGIAIALYNHYLQMGGSELIACPAASGDCAKRILFEFGYMTFPLLAFTLFAFLLMLALFARRGYAKERLV